MQNFSSRCAREIQNCSSRCARKMQNFSSHCMRELQPLGYKVFVTKMISKKNCLGSTRRYHLMFFVFFAFSNLRRVRGFRSSLGGPNYARCRCVEKKIDVRVFERLENLEEGTRVLVVSWRTAFCNNLPASARIRSRVSFFDVCRFFRVFKPRGRYVDFGRLLADPIMQNTVVKQLFFSS